MHTRWNLVLVLMILLAPFAGMVEAAPPPIAQLTAPPPQEPNPPSAGSNSARAVAATAPHPQAVTALGDDVLVNDPAGETTALTQNNAVIAYNADTGALCAAYNDSYHGHVEHTGYTGFSSSTDGGATWVDRGAVTGGPGESYGSPTLVWRRTDGYFYLAALYSGGLGLWRLGATCDTATWIGMIHNGSDEKGTLAVDNNPASPYSGRLYATWTDFSNGHIYAARSGDGGQIWSAPVDVSGHDQVNGAWPAVDPSTGDVYVAWTHWDVYPDGPIDVEMARSTDGGATWTALTNPMSNHVNPRDAAATTTCGQPALNGDIRYSPYPQIAVDRNGILHAVYSYDSDGYNTGDVVNIYYRRSTDQGASWEGEIRVNDNWNNTDQFSPALAVGETGAIGVFWYDRRLDSTNNLLYDRYMAISHDSGATFDANQRISDESSPVVAGGPGLATCYHGDYDGATAGGGYFYTVWGDDRRGDADVWSDSEPYFWGRLSGTVYDATTRHGLPGAAVKTVHLQTGTPFAAAGDSVGSYEMAVPGDETYAVTAQVYGYAANTVTTTVEADGGRADIPLTPVAHWSISGRIVDAVTDYPVYAHITVTGDPLNPPAPNNETWSDPFTGLYTFPDLATAIPYTLTFTATGYVTLTYFAGELDAHLVNPDLTLQPDLVACTALGYKMTPPCQSAAGAVLQPARVKTEGCACETQSHTLFFANHTGANEEVLLSYISSAGVSADMPASLGVVPDTAVRPFDVALKIDRGVRYSTTVVVTVTASLASHPALSDTTVIAKRVLDPIGWEARANSPTASMDGAVIGYGGKLYTIGGYGSNGAVDIYDPATDSWTTGVSEPSPIIDYPGDACFGYVTPTDPVILLLPDASGDVTGMWHRYHIASNTWDTATLPAVLPADGIWGSDIVVDTHNNRCYITGGATTIGGGDLTTLYRYDPAANTAALLGNFTHIPGGFNHHAGWYVPWIGTAGGVCVGGGIDNSDIVYADTQCYDIAADTFNPPNAELGPLPQLWWGMADMEVTRNGEYQLWLANGMMAINGATLRRSAYFGQNVGKFSYGPDSVNTGFRGEGAVVNGEVYLVEGSAGGFMPATKNERLLQCPECDCGVAIAKNASAEWAYPGDGVTYTVVITRPAWFTGTAALVDALPADATFAGNISATYGTAWYSPTANAIYWTRPVGDYSAAGAGSALEVFTNTWAESAVGLAYNPDGGYVRYVHESSNNSERNTHDIAYPAPHASLHSFDLSEVNPGWQKWRSGIAYDPGVGHYFLTDYGGGGARYDNIIEIDPAGHAINGWETYEANNDSYDGALIHDILDIAVVPGAYPRYFVTALNDGGQVYELDLDRAGLFVDDTWGKVMTCTVPGLSDTAGIDYDAQNGVLYHSDWDSNAIVVTDLACNALATFACGVPGAQNSGLTFIEGQWPPEVWAMDHHNDTTTRCEAVGYEPLPEAITITFHVTVTASVSTTVANTATLAYASPAARPAPAILHLRTTNTAGSVQRALNELGYVYDNLYAYSDWTTLDFAPYDVVLIGMTGGLIDGASVQKIRTDVIDQGKRVIFVGGYYSLAFVNGVNQYLVANDTANYNWEESAPPHFKLVDPAHPLAQGLPLTRTLVDGDAARYQLRVTDPAIEAVAQNGDGYPSYFRKTYPGGGELIWFIHSALGTYWTAPADFQLLQRLIGNALPQERAAVAEHALHVTPRPAITWTTEIYVNGNYVGRYDDGPFTVVPADEIQLVDRLDYVGRDPLFVQLTEDWAAYPVTLAEEYHTRGVMTSSDGDWAVTLTPETSVRLVKTLRIADLASVTLSEQLSPDGMAAVERSVTFQPPQFAQDGPAVAYNGRLITYTLTFTSQNSLLDPLDLIDVLPSGVEYVAGPTASYGAAWYDNSHNAIYWTNTPTVTLTRAASLPLPPSAPLSLTPTPLSPSASWHNAAPLPQGAIRYAHAQCPGDPNRFYLISGVGDGYTDKLWRYDADTDVWTALAPFPNPGEGAAAACYQGRIYVVGGTGGMNRFFIYDIARDAWTEGPGLPRHVWGAALGAWEGRLYLAGGDNDIFLGGASDAVNIYDIAAETWAANGAAMPTATFLPGWVQVNASLYVVGGFSADANANIAVTQRYNMAGNSWETGPTFTSARANFTLAATNQYLYAIGGDANGDWLWNAVTLTERLDYTAWNSAAWTDIGDPLPTGLVAYGGGFCTTAKSGGEVWSVSGLTSDWVYTTTNQYRPSEPCVSIPPTVTLAFTARVTAGAGARVTNTAQMNAHGFLLTAASAFDVPLPAWSKQINGVPWRAGFSVIVEPEDIFTVTDVITTPSAFTLRETWDSDPLELIDVITSAGVALSAPATPPGAYAARPAVEMAPSAAETFDWHVPAGTTRPLTLTTVFRVRPGDWTRTTVTESLSIGDWTAARPVAVVWSAALHRIYLPLALRDYPQ